MCRHRGRIFQTQEGSSVNSYDKLETIRKDELGHSECGASGIKDYPEQRAGPGDTWP